MIFIWMGYQALWQNEKSCPFCRGLEAVIVDYARPSVVGNILPKVAHLSLYLLSAGTLVGLLALIYNGPGIGKSVMNFWAIGSGSAPAQRA